MTIISHRRIEYVTQYDLSFYRTNNPGSGFSFPCDEHGVVKLSELHPVGYLNFLKCTSGGVDVAQPTISKRQYRHHIPGEIECECGHRFYFGHHFTNTCDECGADYNGSGQRLAPREQWGEETGETYSDIVNGVEALS